MPPAEDASRLDLNLYIGLRLRILRRVQKVTLEELAEAVDVSRQQIQKYEAGVNRISAVTLYALARRLGVPITYFFEGLPNGEVAAQQLWEDCA